MKHVVDPRDTIDTPRHWNETAVALTNVRRIETMISERAAHHPDRIVCVFGHDDMTYATLERRATLLAARLITLGVGRGEYVLVDVARDHSVLVAWLAVLKTGAAFMPLDPEDATEKCKRLAGMPEVRFAISNSALRPQLLGLGLRQICFALKDLDSQDDPPTPIHCNDGPDTPAYAIATSGSTGEPKCVVMTHRPVFNLFDWIGRHFKLRARDRGLWISPASFDLSIFDLLGLPALGASVHIVPTEARRDPGAVAQILADHRITFWNSAPALLYSVLPFLKRNPTALSELRLAFLSGDFIPLALPDMLRDRAAQVDFIALGGATEAAIWSNYFPVGHVDPAWQSIPYGRPIQNARYYILSPEGDHVAAGQVGELFIGGNCLAIGYLGDPVQTDKNFVPDPFIGDATAKMYRTGDQAQFWDDGTIEILGRVDRQVKVSGYRVHLGEVEAAMRQVGLDPCVAVAIPGQTQSHRIVAAIEASAPPDDIWQPKLKDILSHQMIPDQVLRLPALPLTANGKVDRTAIIDMMTVQSVTSADPRPASPDDGAMLDILTREVASLLRPEARIDPDAQLGALGLGSLEFALLVGHLFEKYDLTVNPVLFFEAGTLRVSASRIAESAGEPPADNQPKTVPQKTIAGNTVVISGMSFKLPGATGLDDLWGVLNSGQSHTGSAPAQPARWLDPARRAGFLPNIDCFDAGFFRVTPREAALMDPRQRLLLETAWSAIEDAGVDPAHLSGEKIGVFVGATGDDFSRLAHRDEAGITPYTMTGISPSLLANRLSFTFDFNGPSECIDTACSSSLVALDRARAAIQNGDCTSALVCGVSLMLDDATDQALTRIGMLSPSGACHTFDADADGYARGEGVVALYLAADVGATPGHARILASCVNHNGRAVSLTAPTPKGQSAAISTALSRSGIDPDTIGMIEMHGTGTALGDPIEVRGLIDGFGENAVKNSTRPQCGLGSIKASIGHLEAAAGLAGIVRAILCARHGHIPAVTGLRQVNPNIDLTSTRFFIPEQASPWPVPDTEFPDRRVAVSSFGFGGTNAHVILECPASGALMACPEVADAPVILPLSARSPEELTVYAEQIATYCTKLSAGQIGDGILRRISRTLQKGRTPFKYRASVTARTLSEAQTLFAELSKKSDPCVALAADGVHLSGAALGWVQGDAPAWPKDEVPPISLPTYPFRQDRHWPDWHNASSDTTQKIDMQPYRDLIEQHQINGDPMIPAALFVTLLFDAASELPGGPFRTLHAIRLRRNLHGPDIPEYLTLCKNPVSGGWQLSLKLPDKEDILCSATTRAADSNQIDTLQYTSDDEGTTQTHAKIYARFRDIGADFGPRLRVLGTSEFSGLECRTRLSADTEGPMARPVQIEGAFQTALLLALNRREESGVPATIKHLTLHRPQCAPDRAIAKSSDVTGSVDVMLADGTTPVLSLTGMRGLPKPINGDLALFTRSYGREIALDPGAVEPDLIMAEPGTPLGKVLNISSSFQADDPPSSDLRQRVIIVDASGAWQDIVGRLIRLVPSLARHTSVRLVLLCQVKSPQGSPKLAAFGAFCQSLRQEYPEISASAIGVIAQDWTEVAAREMRWLLSAHSLSASGIFDPASHRLYESVLTPVNAQDSAPETGGVYIVTGGLKGIGAQIARHLVTQRQARVVICGRTADGPDIQAALSAICAGSADIAYKQADVTVRTDMCELVQSTRDKFGPVTGVVHGAGIIADGLLHQLGQDDFAAVLAPKLDGARHLDFATRNEPLTHFVVFSSLVASTGAIGQCAYGFANGMIEGFATQRAALQAQGSRAGRTTCVAWGPWFTGMQMPEGTLARLRDRHGLEAFGSLTGLTAFESALAQNTTSLVAVSGDTVRLRQWLAMESQTMEQTQIGNDNMQLDTAKNLILEALADECLLSVSDIDPSLPFEEFGVDSAIILGVTEQLEAELGPLPKTLFFESRTVSELAQKLTEISPAAHQSAPAQVSSEGAGKTAQPDQIQRDADADDSALRATPSVVRASKTAATDEPVAVIGMDGQFPQSDTLEEFWQVLEEGRDCISEVPADRWDHSLVAPDHKNFGPESGFRWGGFLRAPYAFAPAFFRMSRREAEMIDPQERLFLLSAYRCLAEAGYPAGTLAGKPVGVYAGTMWSQYQMWGIETGLAATSFASIANRVSYSFGFTGPSIGLDTMCSSSLTAIHLACGALQRGEIEAAIAGGVNVNTHPNKHIFLCNRHFASPDGRCRAFGAEGDGYVASEGVGTVMLKRLSQAEADGDTINGLILGSAVNHDGKTSGYTVPNPVSQTDVVRTAQSMAGVDPKTISYVEAHGTGTALGDPIEVKALSDAFGLGPEAEKSCIIGSVKANIGHAESAAGMAGLLKVLLQMQHKRIAPSIHAEPINPNIDFDSTPFSVATSGSDWQGSVNAPLRAGISSFGASGANAHVILQDAPLLSFSHAPETSGHIIPLGATSDAGLKVVIRQLHDALVKAADARPTEPVMPADKPGIEQILDIIAETLTVDRSFVTPEDRFEDYGMDANERATLQHEIARVLDVAEAEVDLSQGGPANLIDHAGTAQLNKSQDPDIADIAYTLQTGREPLSHRMAMVVGSVPELVELVERALSSTDEHPSIHYGTTERLLEPKELTAREATLTDNLLSAGQLPRLAQLWCQGAINLAAIARRHPRRRVRLPPYPFELDDCRVPNPTLIVSGQAGPLSPLVDRIDLNASMEPGVRMIKRLSTRSAPVNSEGVLDLVGALAVAASSAFLVEGKTAEMTGIEWTGDQQLRQETSDLLINITPDTVGKRIALGLKDQATALTATVMPDVTDSPVDWADLTSNPTASGSEEQDLNSPDAADKASLAHQFEVDPGTYTDTLYSSLTSMFRLASERAGGETLVAERLVLKGPIADRGRIIRVDRGHMRHLALIGSGGKVMMEVSLNTSTAEKTLASVPQVSEKKEPVAKVKPPAPKAPVTPVAQMNGTPTAQAQIKNSHTQDVATDPADPAHTSGIPFPQQLNWVETDVDAPDDTGEGNVVILSTRSADPLRRSVTRLLGERVVETFILKEDCDFDSIQSVLDSVPDLTEIIVLSSGSAPVLEEDGLNMALEQSVLPLLAVARHLAQHAKPPAVRLLTQGAFKLGQEPVHPASTMATTMLAVLGREHPKLPISSIDLESSLSARKLAQMVEVALPMVRCDLVQRGGMHALRDGHLYVRSLAPMPTPAQADPPFIKGECCLIVGGSGVVGRQITDIMARDYGANIHWIGRQSAPDDLEGTTARVEAAGGHLSYHSADVADANALQDIFDSIQDSGQTLRSVIHCGMGFKVGRLADLDSATLYDGLRAKVHGSVALVKNLEYGSAEQLILMSSGESLSGNPGWGVYGAACAFQDALAEDHDPEAGLRRVLSVNWGYWQGSNRGDPNTLRAKGVYPLEADRGFDALKNILRSDTPRAAAIDVDPSVIKRMHLHVEGFDMPETPSIAVEPERPAKVETPDPVPPVNQPDATPVAPRAATTQNIQARITDLLAHSLRIDPETIDPDTDIVEYGVDSILVLDFISLIEEHFGEVPADEIVEHQTIRAISDYLEGYLALQDPEDTPVASDFPTETTPVPDVEEPETGSAKAASGQDGVAHAAAAKNGFPLISTTTRGKAAEALLDYPDRFDAKADGKAGMNGTLPMPDDFQIRLVPSSDGAAMEVITCGTGRPVLMLPGIGLTAPIFHHQFKTLCENHQLIVIHAPGHGRSDTPKIPKVETLVKKLEETLDTLQLSGPVDVVASCFGTLVAMRLATVAPHLVRSLCLCGAFSENSDFSPVPTDGLTAKQLAEITLAAANSLASDFDAIGEFGDNQDRQDDIRSGRAILLASQKAKPSIGMRYLNDVLSLKPTQWLGGIKAPTSFVTGTLDSIVGPNAAHDLAQHMASARVVEIEGAGHYPFLSHPDLFERVLYSHLQEAGYQS